MSAPKVHLERIRGQQKKRQDSSATRSNSQHRTLDEQLKNPTQEELSTLLKVPKSQIKNISDYRILERLGRGTFSRVYRALSPEKEIVAIKEYNFALTLDHFDEEKEAFQREAALFRDLGRHPQVPSLVAIAARVSEHTGNFIEYNPSIVMEHVTGKTLSERILLKERFAPEEIRDLIEQSFSPLQELHHGNSQPRFHRDIKPANLKKNDQGLLYLLDFGSVRDTLIGSTFGGTMGKGSLGYVHKEQFAGNPSFRTDLYSLGRTLYAVAIGKEMGPYEEFSKEKLDQTNLDSRTKDTIEILCKEDLSGPQNVSELRDYFHPEAIEVRGEDKHLLTHEEIKQASDNMSSNLEVVGEGEIDKKTLNTRLIELESARALDSMHHQRRSFTLPFSLLSLMGTAVSFYGYHLHYDLFMGIPLIASIIPAGFGLNHLSKRKKESIEHNYYKIRPLIESADELSQGTLVQGRNLRQYKSMLEESEKRSFFEPIYPLSLSSAVISYMVSAISYFQGEIKMLLGSLAVGAITTPIGGYFLNKGLRDHHNQEKSKEAIRVINEKDPEIKEARRRAFDLKFDNYTHEHEEQRLGYFERRRLRKRRKQERKRLLDLFQGLDERLEDLDMNLDLESVFNNSKRLEAAVEEEREELTQKLGELHQEINEIAEESPFLPLQRQLAEIDREYDQKRPFYLRGKVGPKKKRSPLSLSSLKRGRDIREVTDLRRKVEDIETAISLVNYVYDKYSKAKEYATSTLQKITRRDDYSVAIRRLKRNINEFSSTGMAFNDLEFIVRDTETKRIELGIEKTRCNYTKLRKINARNRNRYLSDQVRKMSLKGDRRADFYSHINELNELYQSFPDEKQVDIDHFEWLWKFNNIRLAQYNSVDEKVKAYIGAVDMFEHEPEHVKVFYREAINQVKGGLKYGWSGVESTFEKLKNNYNKNPNYGINQLIEGIYNDVIQECVPQILSDLLIRKARSKTWFPEPDNKVAQNYFNDLKNNLNSTSKEHVTNWSNHWNDLYLEFIRNKGDPEAIKMTSQLKEMYRSRELQLATMELNEANKALTTS